MGVYGGPPSCGANLHVSHLRPGTQRQVTAELARGRHGESSGQTSVLADGETQKVYNIVYSQAVTHPSTNTTQRCLTSVIGRELVLST